MAGGSGFNVNVPDPAAVQLEGNKTDVYERQQVRREKDRRMQSLSDLAGRLLEGKGQTDSVSGRPEAYGSRRTPTKGSPSNWRPSMRHRRKRPAAWNRR
ncbi:hypothetical protein ACMSEY_04515 [Bacteroides thetaiotaomicron]|uniref:hypothetical protein n=1 Tax=Bacteroides thetaiotaomicron TaxID=818 RepID=UPI0039C4927C